MTAQKPESVVALSPVVTVVIAGVLLLMQPAPSVLSPTVPSKRPTSSHNQSIT
jgi:hypothetical protein